MSASAFMSSGVARNTGEWSHVQVSLELTGFPYRWLADVAHRVVENRLHCAPSPSGRSARRWLESVTGGIPYVCDRNFVPCALAHAVSGFRRSEEHTSELQSLRHLVCRLLL